MVVLARVGGHSGIGTASLRMLWPVSHADPDTAEAGKLLEQVAALKHDLGKYVAWTSANLDDAVWDGPVAEELVAALRADLLETRKHGDRRESAWEVWRAHLAALPQPLEPELEAVAAAVARLERVGPALVHDDREALAEARASIRAAQQDIRLQLRDLHRRLYRNAMGAIGES